MIHLHPPAPVYSLAFSPDSMWLAGRGADGVVRLWDAVGTLTEYPTAGVGRGPISWAPGGRQVVSGTEGGLFAVRVGGAVTDLPLPASCKPITGLGHLSDDLLVIGSGTGIHLFDVATRSERRGPQVERKAVRALAVHRQTKLVAWTTGEHRLRVWRVTSPDKLDVPLGKPAHALDVSPDGELLAVAVDYTIRLIPAGVKHAVRELTGHKGRVSGVAFSADGRTAVTASWDQTVRVWDVATGLERTRFPLAVGQLTAVAVSPDGTRFAAAGADGPVVLLDAD